MMEKECYKLMYALNFRPSKRSDSCYRKKKDFKRKAEIIRPTQEQEDTSLYESREDSK